MKYGSTKKQNLKIGLDTQVELTDKQCGLLSQYRDGELRGLKRWLTTRLIARSVQAQEFLLELDCLNADLNQIIPACEVDLWSKISAAIDNEARSAIYLGRKKIVAEKRGSWSDRIGIPSWGYGFGAGVCSAALVLFIVIPGHRISENKPTQISQNSLDKDGAGQRAGDARFENARFSEADIQGTDFDLNPATRNIGLLNASSGDYRAISTTGGGEPTIRKVNPVEIDWVRSDGRLRVMRDAQESNPVIFVAPRSRASGLSGSPAAGRESSISRRPARAKLAPFDDAFGSVAQVPQVSSQIPVSDMSSPYVVSGAVTGR